MLFSYGTVYLSFATSILHFLWEVENHSVWDAIAPSSNTCPIAKTKVQFKSLISCENFYYRLIFGFKIHETSSNNYFEKTWFAFFLQICCQLDHKLCKTIITWSSPKHLSSDVHPATVCELLSVEVQQLLVTRLEPRSLGPASHGSRSQPRPTPSQDWSRSAVLISWTLMIHTQGVYFCAINFVNYSGGKVDCNFRQMMR